MVLTLLNGQYIQPDQPVLYADDRGFHYGDGLFETMLLKQGKVRFLEDHWQRIAAGCEKLSIPMPDEALFEQELKLVTAKHDSGVVKFILSRGRGERGYRYPSVVTPTRLWQFSPSNQTHSIESGIRVRLCATRLARNPSLANIKHCNRLEQILAQNESQDAEISEGLMLDTDGELVCATMSNIFLIVDQVLVTPDLRFCGIQGVMRKNILKLAGTLDVPVEVRAVRGEELYSADHVFLTNAVRGIRAVTMLDQHCWSLGALTQQLILALDKLS